VKTPSMATGRLPSLRLFSTLLINGVLTLQGNLNLPNSPPVSTFVVVHGAWQSTGTWDLLVPLLKKHRDKVIIPILHGC
jgi:hypothetical protein